MDDAHQFLLVADRSHAQHMERTLRASGIAANCSRVDTPGQLVAALREKEWDIVAQQLGLSQLSVEVALALLSDYRVDTPIIAVADQDDGLSLLKLAETQPDRRVIFCSGAWLAIAARQAHREAELRRELQREKRRTLENEERYLDLIDRVDDIVYAHDEYGIFTVVNRAAERITGYRREEILHRNFAEFIAPEYLEIARAGRAGVPVDEPTVYELEIIAKDGRRIPLAVSSWLIVRGGVAREVHGLARDLRLSRG